MIVDSDSGEQLWKSREDFAGTQTYLKMPFDNTTMILDDLEKDSERRYYIPSRLLTADLDGDQVSELIIAKNERAYTTILARVREFKKGTIHSLSYNQMAMRQNWRSKDLPAPWSTTRSKTTTTTAARTWWWQSPGLRQGAGGVAQHNSCV